MGRRSLRTRTGIANLGIFSKKRKIEPEQSEDKENGPEASVSGFKAVKRRALESLERASRVFAEIVNPTWHEFQKSEPEHQKPEETPLPRTQAQSSNEQHDIEMSEQVTGDPSASGCRQSTLEPETSVGTDAVPSRTGPESATIEPAPMVSDPENNTQANDAENGDADLELDVVEAWEDEDEEFLTLANINNEDNGGESEQQNNGSGQIYTPPPTKIAARAALKDLNEILNPRRKSGVGHVPFKGGTILRRRLQMVQQLLVFYTDETSRATWISASLHIAKLNQKSPHTAKMIRKWARDLIASRDHLPVNLFGTAHVSLLKNEDLASDIFKHLQSVGRNVQAADINQFLARPEVKEKYALRKNISHATAKRWMIALGYRWTREPKGQYIDGHDRPDVVQYRQVTFLPTMEELEWCLRVWNDGIEEARASPLTPSRYTVVWYHDESTFFQNDRRKFLHVHKDETPKPQPKGEGPTIMIADFVSADYGWLMSPDGSESARVIFRAGKAREGYFSNEDVMRQVKKAMEICKKHYPNEDHIFVYDNATTHQKRMDSAPCARKMTKGPSKNVNKQPLYAPDGEPVVDANGKQVIQPVEMTGGKLPSGEDQSFYFPQGHPKAGYFKGIVTILEERGYTGVANMLLTCDRFDCKDERDEFGNRRRCCLRRLIYDEPDIVLANNKSALEDLCEKEGFHVLFLPKFHCELNPIEQCWGYAKRRYRLRPLPKSDEEFERNVITALDEIPLRVIRRFVMRSRRFMNLYRRGLNGRQAAWASRKYRGHRVIPMNLLRALSEEGINVFY